jgi:hypothetical protein
MTYLKIYTETLAFVIVAVLCLSTKGEGYRKKPPQRSWPRACSLTLHGMFTGADNLTWLPVLGWSCSLDELTRKLEGLGRLEETILE